MEGGECVLIQAGCLTYDEAYDLMVLKSGDDERLSQLQTSWTKVFAGAMGSQTTIDTHEGTGSLAEAQRELLIRYAGPVYRYLRGAVGSADVADDLAQEFALRFVRGDFRAANPQRGRFRDFVKRSLRNLFIDYFRRKNKTPKALSIDLHELLIHTTMSWQMILTKVGGANY